MKKFFRGFNKNKKKRNSSIPLNGFEEKNFKKLSPNVSFKRSKFIVNIVLLALISSIIGALFGIGIDRLTRKDNYINTKDIHISGDGCNAGEAVSLKAAPCVVGLRCVIKRDGLKADKDEKGMYSSMFPFFPFFNGDSFDESSEGDSNIDDIIGSNVKQVEYGSGVIVEKDENSLYIITNFHVIKDTLRGGKNGSIEVYFVKDAKSCSPAAANVLGYDPMMDVAVLKVPLDAARGKTFGCAEIGDSDTLKQGSTVFCLGSPNGISYNGTMTHGIISAVNRELKIPGIKKPIKLIQTDAAMNPGNSGGGLFDTSGKLVAINIAKACTGKRTISEGVGFSLPINFVDKSVKKIIRNKKGEIEEKIPTLGVIVDEGKFNIYPFMDFGVLVREVVYGSAAANAGIRPGDFIFEFDGKKVKTVEDLDVMLSMKKDKVAKIRIKRFNPKTRTFKELKPIEVNLQ